jgi:hypothetical protein
VSTEEPAFTCRNCGRLRTGEKPDNAGWCAACRAEVVRRATVPAWVATLVVAALLMLALWWAGAFYSRFVVMWLALAALAAFGAFKVARRVAFEIVRARGVTPPPGSAEAP